MHHTCNVNNTAKLVIVYFYIHIWHKNRTKYTHIFFVQYHIQLHLLECATSQMLQTAIVKWTSTFKEDQIKYFTHDRSFESPIMTKTKTWMNHHDVLGPRSHIWRGNKTKYLHLPVKRVLLFDPTEQFFPTGRRHFMLSLHTFDKVIIQVESSACKFLVRYFSTLLFCKKDSMGFSSERWTAGSEWRYISSNKPQPCLVPWLFKCQLSVQQRLLGTGTTKKDTLQMQRLYLTGRWKTCAWIYGKQWTSSMYFQANTWFWHTQ